MPLAESAQDLVYDATGDIGQTIVSTGVTVRQSLVIEAHQMQNGGMKIVNVDDVFCNVDAVDVGFSMGDTGLYAATGQPG